MKVLYSKIENGDFHFTNLKEKQEYLEENKNYKGLFCHAITKTTRERTDPQNRSLHLYLTWLAKELNERGFTCKYILGTKTVELDWTMELAKDLIWRPIQIALIKKKSTTKLEKVGDIDTVYEHLNRFFSNEPFCFHIPFPSDPTKKYV